MDFTSALDTNIDDIHAPKPLPVGTYRVAVTKPHEIKPSSNGEWEIMQISLKVLEAESDVDPDDLADFGKVAGTPLRYQFFFPTADEEVAQQERALSDLKRFLQRTLRIDFTTLSEGLAEIPNTQFLAVVKHTPNKNDPEIVYAEVASVAPLAD